MTRDIPKKINKEILGAIFNHWINNPNLCMTDTAVKYGIHATELSRLITKHYLGTKSTNAEVIIKQSKMNF